jgi:hypothetical protein
MSSASPLGGNVGDPGAPTISMKMSMTAPWEAVMEIRECPPFNMKTSMAGPLGGSDGDLGAPTIQRENVNDSPPWEMITEI